MKADLHVHTLYSHDAVITLQELEEWSLKRGIDCIAITDHEEIRGALKARKNLKRVRVIPGVEFYTEYGHVIGLNIEKYPPNRKGMDGLEILEYIRAEGGLSILAHPLDHRRGKPGEIDEIVRRVDIIEVANSHDPKAKINYVVLSKLAEDLGKGVSAGSDSHIPETIGYSHIYTDAEDVEQLLEKIMRREVRILFRTVTGRQRVKKLFLEALHKARLYRPSPP